MEKTLYEALIILIMAFFVRPASAKTMRAGTGCAVKSINKAISLASPGDTLLVSSGTYNENIVINKPLVIKGLGGHPVIDGKGRLADVVRIISDNVVFDGFKIINSGRSSLQEYCGIKVVERKHCVIKNNILRNNSASIYLQNASFSAVQHNDIDSQIKEIPTLGNAIHCWKCNTVRIENNRVGRHRDGIYLEFVTNSAIAHNTVSGCLRYGLHFMFSNHDTYTSNTFRNSLAGVAVMYSHHINMSGNIFEMNHGESAYGLLLKEIANASISGNIFRKNTIGIFIDGGTLMQIKGNSFKENGWGMRIVASSTSNKISGNNFIGNTFDVSTNSTYNSNTFNKNYWDKYSGYDLNRDGIGDVPYYPLSLFSTLAENNTSVMLFFHSFIMELLNKSEKIIPSITPDNFVDETPLMHPHRK